MKIFNYVTLVLQARPSGEIFQLLTESLVWYPGKIIAPDRDILLTTYSQPTNQLTGDLLRHRARIQILLTIKTRIVLLVYFRDKPTKISKMYLLSQSKSQSKVKRLEVTLFCRPPTTKKFSGT